MRLLAVLLLGLLTLGGCQKSGQPSQGAQEQVGNTIDKRKKSSSLGGEVKADSQLSTGNSGELGDNGLPEGDDIFDSDSKLSDTCFEDLNAAHDPSTERPFTVGEILSKIESNDNVSNLRVDDTANGHIVRFSLLDPLTEQSTSYSYELSSPEGFSVACKGKNGLFFGDSAADGRKMTLNESTAILIKLDIYSK